PKLSLLTNSNLNYIEKIQMFQLVNITRTSAKHLPNRFKKSWCLLLTILWQSSFFAFPSYHLVYVVLSPISKQLPDPLRSSAPSLHEFAYMYREPIASFPLHVLLPWTILLQETWFHVPLSRHNA